MEHFKPSPSWVFMCCFNHRLFETDFWQILQIGRNFSCSCCNLSWYLRYLLLANCFEQYLQMNFWKFLFSIYSPKNLNKLTTFQIQRIIHRICLVVECWFRTMRSAYFETRNWHFYHFINLFIEKFCIKIPTHLY